MWSFVDDNIHADPAALRLKYHVKALGFDIEEAITQIECRQRFGKKLAETLLRAPRFMFPSVLSGEQATSDRLARFHASLVSSQSPAIIDLTAGLGIDAWHMAATHPDIQVTALDIDPAKSHALAYNAGQLALPTLHALNADCRQYLASHPTPGTAPGASAPGPSHPSPGIAPGASAPGPSHPSPGTALGASAPGHPLFFIDPARRALDGSRVYSLADCQPDITQIIPELPKGATLIVKASPMLDITHSISQLQGSGTAVARAIAVGTPTECRELVFVCRLGAEAADIDHVPISAVTLTDDSDLVFDFDIAAERAAIAPAAAAPVAGQHMLVPYPAVMKAAPFRLIAATLGCAPIAPNTHLYISDNAPDTPLGAWQRIVEVIPYESKYIKRLKRTYPAIRVTTRNFDIPADALRRKLGVRDAGNLRLFAVTLADSTPVMIITDTPLDMSTGAQE